MTLEQIAYLAEIVAALAVVASLIYVARQLSQNNEQLAAQARATRVSNRLNAYLLPVNDRDLADALIKQGNREPLSECENLILGRYIGSLLVAFQHVYAESRRGLIDEGSIPVETWRKMFSGEDAYWPELTPFWAAHIDALDPDFVQWMEENVVNER
jgi:hypothetical protein